MGHPRAVRRPVTCLRSDHAMRCRSRLAGRIVGAMSTPHLRRLRWAVPGGVAAAVAVAALGSQVAASASDHPSLPTSLPPSCWPPSSRRRRRCCRAPSSRPPTSGCPTCRRWSAERPAARTSRCRSSSRGSHTLRVWLRRARQAAGGAGRQTSESDVVHNGTDLWIYTSTTRQVTHATLPRATPSLRPSLPTRSPALTPQAAAEQALAAIDPTTKVDRRPYGLRGRPVRVPARAGPEDARSLVGSVRIALDSETSVPLRVQVFARGATTPALQVGFTDVSMGAPDASIFHFVKPAGTDGQDSAACRSSATLGVAGHADQGRPGRRPTRWRIALESAARSSARVGPRWPR